MHALRRIEVKEKKKQKHEASREADSSNAYFAENQTANAPGWPGRTHPASWRVDAGASPPWPPPY